MAWKTIKDLDIKNKTVLVRVDINVPFADGKITDATRIERIKPTIDYILSQNAKPVLLAHFGRPKGEIVSDMSLAPIAGQMDTILGHDVAFCAQSIGDEALNAIEALATNTVLILENTRFHKGEEKNDAALAERFAELGDIYCNDAFSAAHRAHASTEGLARKLPSCAGLLMAAELSALEAALTTPKRPVVAIVGGAKISTKLDLLSNLIEKTDHIIIGGGMANTFMAAKGQPVGKSLCEHDLLDTAREILTKAEKDNCEIYLPSDIVVSKEFKQGADYTIHNSNDCPDNGMILDAGPQAVKDIQAIFDQCKTLVWNGPLGAFEIAPFDMATNSAAKYAAKLTKNGDLVSIAGGGDTVSALNASASADDFTYISTAGGAFLEWMEGKTLPGVAALN